MLLEQTQLEYAVQLVEPAQLVSGHDELNCSQNNELERDATATIGVARPLGKFPRAFLTPLPAPPGSLAKSLPM